MNGMTFFSNLNWYSQRWREDWSGKLEREIWKLTLSVICKTDDRKLLKGSETGEWDGLVNEDW
jgi:hypothetical protein